MTSLLAGLYSSSSSVTSRAPDLLAATFPRNGPAAGIVSHDGLSVAWSAQVKQAHEPADRFFCVVDGRVDDLERLARELGLSPDAEKEALLGAAFARWGSNVLARLRGSFTLVLWDREDKRGLIAVDQLGAGALFFHSDGTTLCFASEIRDLLRLLPRRPGPDTGAVAQWIADGALARGQTLYERVSRLEGGRFLELRDGSWRGRQYWAPRYRGVLQLEPEELNDEVRSTVERAVRRRLPSQGNPGVLLSGGLDSSTVTALTRRLLPEDAPLRTYSAVFPRYPEIDETALIADFTRELNLPNRQVVVEPGSLLAPSLRFLSEWEVPSLSANLAFILALAEAAAKDGAAVLLDGEGGDEDFGCEPYLLADRLRRGRLFSMVELARRLPYGEVPPWRCVRHDVWEYGVKGAVPRFANALARRLRGPARYSPSWLRPDAARAYHEAVDPRGWKGLAGPVWWTHAADTLTATRERLGAHDLFRRERRLGGIEGAHPFLDDLDLVELALQLPPESAFSHRLTRPLFRSAMAGIVPDQIRLRPAKGVFTGLLYGAIHGPDRAPILDLVMSPEAEIGRYVVPKIVRRELIDLLPERRAGPPLWILWRLAATEVWLRFQADRSFPDRFREQWSLRAPGYELKSVGASGA